VVIPERHGPGEPGKRPPVRFNSPNAIMAAARGRVATRRRTRHHRRPAAPRRHRGAVGAVVSGFQPKTKYLHGRARVAD
jgi:hypothetical protein